MDPYVQTERLELLCFTAEGADLLIELDSDPAVMRYLTGGEPTVPDAVVRERVIPMVLATYERWDGRFGLFAAYAKRDGAFLGWFSLRPDPDGPPDEVELGYRLRQAAWGKGYATEGSQALVAKAFAKLDVRVVWGETMAVNVASQKVMEKVGMTVAQEIPTPEDMLAVEGSERGGYRYEIVRDHWRPETEELAWDSC